MPFNARKGGFEHHCHSRGRGSSHRRDKIGSQQSFEVGVQTGGRATCLRRMHNAVRARLNRPSLLIRFSDCRRFCICQSTRFQRSSTAFTERPATGSIAITWKPKISTSFNDPWNLVRDQWGGVSNFLGLVIAECGTESCA